MVHVKIKEIKSRMHIFLQSADVEEMLQQFQQSLPPLQPDARAAAFFHVPPLSDQQALRFLRLCQAHQIGILGINPGTQDPSCMRIVEQHVHSGERLSLQEETMLFGSVRPGGTLACTATLCVMGSVEGVVDLFHADDVLYAGALKEARIRIGDSAFARISCPAPCKVSAEGQRLICRRIQDSTASAPRCD